jgi:hypothetical protein
MEHKMATQQINGSPVTNTSTKNYGGVVKTNGTSSAPVSTENVVLEGVDVFGSVVVDGLESDKALSAGTFAFNNRSPVAMKVSQELSGVANDFLLSGANNVGDIRSIQYQQVKDGSTLIDGVRTTQTTKAIREGKWDIYTGKFDAGYPQVSVDTFEGIDGASGDEAAKVDRLNPGVLVYKLSKGVPVSENYDKKTN